MKLSTRLVLMLMIVAVVTAAAVGISGYFFVRQSVIQDQFGDLSPHVRGMAATLEGYTARAGAEARELAEAPTVKGLLAAMASRDGKDPTDGLTVERWRALLSTLFTSVLSANPDDVQIRLIGVADGGRELVRVDRPRAGGAVHTVPSAQLQRKGDRDYFAKAAAGAPGALYVSPIDLNQENGRIEEPHLPVLRAAVPVAGPDGKVAAVVIVYLDMRPIFHSLTGLGLGGSSVFVVNEHGDYLAHPDARVPFGFQLGEPRTWQQDLPDVAEIGPVAGVHMTKTATGDWVAAAIAPALLSGGRQVEVIESQPRAVILHEVSELTQLSIVAAIIGSIVAILLGILMARTVTRPLQQIAMAVDAFGTASMPPLLVDAGGEVGQLARAVAKFAQEEQFYGAVLASSDDAILTKTLDGVITGWNPAAERLYGYTAAEAVGRDIHLIVPAEKQAELDAILAGLPLGRGVAGIETVRRTKDGRDIEVAITVSPVRAPSGEIIGASTIAHDISERRLAGERFRAAVEASSTGMVMVDPAGNIALVNTAIEKMFGYGRDELIGQPVDMLVPDAVRPNHATLRAEYNAAPVRRPMGAQRDLRGRRKDGATFPLEIELSPIVLARGQMVMAGVIDLSERRTLEERLVQSQKLEAIGQLTGGMAHDFNNLLHVIESNAEILTATVKDPYDVQSVELILKAAERGAELTRSLLAFGRRQTLDTKAVPVNELVTHVQMLARRTLGEDIELEAALAPDLPSALADAAQLENAVLNLMINARDAMPRGGKLVIETAFVSVEKAAPGMALDEELTPGDYIQIAVTDTGTGIPPDIVAKVFQPFFTTKEPGKGTGLGLSMVYGLMKQLGGQARIYSEVGRGTAVKLYLPCAPRGATTAVPEPETEMRRGRGERILVVDDNEMVIAAVERQLRSLGYDVTMATNPADAMTRGSRPIAPSARCSPM